MPFPKNAHKHSPIIKPSCINEVIAAIKTEPMIVRQIAKLVFRHPDTVTKVLRDLRGRAYICGWKGQTAIWAYGDKPHVPKPAPTPKSVVTMTGRKKKSNAPYLRTRYVTGERIWGI